MFEIHKTKAFKAQFNNKQNLLFKVCQQKQTEKKEKKKKEKTFFLWVSNSKMV